MFIIIILIAGECMTLLDGLVRWQTCEYSFTVNNHNSWPSGSCYSCLWSTKYSHNRPSQYSRHSNRTQFKSWLFFKPLY